MAKKLENETSVRPTRERLAKNDVIVKGNIRAKPSGETTEALRVEAPSLIEVLYERGVFGAKEMRDCMAERRRDNGFWLMELYEFLYHSEGVARYEPFSGDSKSGAEMSDAEAELRALYHRYLRGLPAVTTQALRFLCKDQQLPRIQIVPLADCLDQLDNWREKERRERRERDRERE